MPEGKIEYVQHILQKGRVRPALAQLTPYPDGA